MTQVEHRCGGIAVRQGHARSRTLALATLLAAGTMLASAGAAFAENPANIKEMSFTTRQIANQEIRVISTNKNTWNAIVPGNYLYGAHLKIDTKFPGWVRHVGIVLGACGGASCAGKPLLWSHSPVQRDYEIDSAFTFPTSKIPVSTTGIASVPFGDQIIAECNTHVTSFGGSAYTFNRAMPLTFVADTFKDIASNPNPFSNGPTPAQWTQQTDHSTVANIGVKVTCVPFQKESVDNVPDDPNFKVKSVALSIRVPHLKWNKPAPDKKCRQANITVHVPTTKPGPVKFRLWTQVGGGAIDKQFVEAWSSAKNEFESEATYSKVVEVTETSFVQAFVEELVNPIGLTDGWKGVDVSCVTNLDEEATPNDPSKNKSTAEVNPTPKPEKPVAVVDPAPKSETPRPAAPNKPEVKVAPLPQLVCLGGHVRADDCVCPPRTEKVQNGAHAYRCSPSKLSRDDDDDKQHRAPKHLQEQKQHREQRSDRAPNLLPAKHQHDTDAGPHRIVR